MLGEKVKLEEYMKKEIQRVSNIQIDELEQKINQIRQETTASLEEAAQIEAGLQVESELRELQSDYAIKVSRLHEETNRKLMQKRAELNEAIFDEMKNKLLTFCGSKEYEKMLNDRISHLTKEESYQNVCIHVAKKDEAYLDMLCKTYGNGCTGCIDESIEIGGFLFICQDDGIVIDETLDNALEEQRQWFFENSGLFIK